MTRLTSALLLSLLTFPGQAIAQDDMQRMHEKMQQQMQEMHGHAAMSDADKAFSAARRRMHDSMPMQFSGDADVDFAKQMISHHQGAVDMAKVALQYGRDPEMRKLAETIVASQEKEIATMKDWLEKHK